MKILVAALLFSWGIVNGLGNRVLAQNDETPPEELTEIIFDIEDAANDRDLDKLLDRYSEDFTQSDGLNVDSLSKALKQMWQDYPQLEYRTEIESWSEEDGLLVAETVTTISGFQNNRGRITRLNSIIKSRQYFEDEKLVEQEILAEQSQLKTGDNPPQVDIVAPKVVTTGEKYNVDLIVNEPLEDKVLLGAIKEDKSSSNLYLNSTELELEPLPAGGIYKTATAPLLPDSNLVSAILVRGDGITVITHRVNIEAKKVSPSK